MLQSFCRIITPNDKTHCSIVDTSLHEYPGVVGKPVFTIFTQQDIAAPLFLITSYQGQLECAHQP